MTLANSLLTTLRDNIKTDIEGLFTHGAIGTDSTTPTAADTALGAEVFRSAIDVFDSAVTNKITATLIVGGSEANGNDVKETGWFDDPSAGTMYVRNTLTTISKIDSIQLNLDTQITILVTEN